MSEWTVPGYSELGELGRGMSGKVVEAVQDSTGNAVAIKYLKPALVRDQAFMWRFRTDAQALRQLRVPQIVQAFDYVERAGQGAALVMELVNGLSLRETIRRRGPIGSEAALAVLKDSLHGLAAAHGIGLFHRDYKPENVLIDTAGRSKLTDFGVPGWADERVQAGGPPPYMAPELWNGAPSSPATDIYAATAVFFECLTGRPPFTGHIEELGWQHNTAAVPLDQVDAPLRSLVAHGMAKNPGGRPQSALAFAMELDAAATAAYGAGWEQRGRRLLAKRGGRNPRRRRRILAVTAITAVPVLAIAAVAAAVEMGGINNDASLSAATSSFKAVASVSPPVVSSKCTTATTFTYSGELTAEEPGKVSYQWVYSTGKQGPVQTVSFTGPGETALPGTTVKTKTNGGGWAEIKLISPGPQTSDKASYQLFCNRGVDGITATAAVKPTAGTTTCATGGETFTATGSITASKAEKISYMWWGSDGQRSAAATLNFTKAGTMAVAPLTVTPAAGTSTGQVALVVNSPVQMASNAATYTVSCQGPSLQLSAAASPASKALTSCTAAEPTITFTGSITDSKAGTVNYYWQLPSGAGPAQTLTFAQAGTEAVTATTYKPASDSTSGSGTIVVTSPAAESSAAATFKLTCATPLTVATTGAPTTATIGKAYSGTVSATGGKSPYTWSATGLPAGLKMSTAGAISGTPTTAGSDTVTVTVKDSSSPALTATASITITVSAVPLAITTSAPATATVGTAYTGTVAATGGTSPYTWSATGLPAGLTMSTGGTISGTPSSTAAGSYTVTVTVKDSSATALTATAMLSIVVSPAATTTTAATTGA